ncbi:hypothetical protein EJ06DRAFT_532304 [Trichodelitschia bisporula]|uniref:CENP-V/GFA domain-containing protein n=1 Tax=Trichodelitschia bisporula TaxID=703511 RepID=A0A6G1HPV0_9PEZI|nr:hypothetical protein EJ06DRAFT_532304 [Trichodelitschia bisporula]
MTDQLRVVCQCRNVSFPAPEPQPRALYHCHCLECRKQSASAFGTTAIFPAEPFFPLAPELKAKLKIWQRPTETGGTMDCYFCPECGVRVFHRICNADGNWRDVISVKAGCIEGLEWNATAHLFARSAVFPIPADHQAFDTYPPTMEGGHGAVGTEKN